MEINILIDKEFSRSLDRRWLRRTVRETLAAEKAGKNIEVGLVITGEGKLRELNRQYRGLDEPTDVLSFALSAPENERDFVLPPDGVRRLGEVIISYPRAEVQAKEHKHPVAREVLVLLIHGILHLLGYDHDKPEPRKIMRSRESAILAAIAASEK